MANYRGLPGRSRSAPADRLDAGRHSRGTFAIAASPAAVVLIDYTEARDGAVALSGRGMVNTDGWWRFGSYGFVPKQPIVARWGPGQAAMAKTCSAAAVAKVALQLSSDVPRDGIPHAWMNTRIAQLVCAPFGTAIVAVTLRSLCLRRSASPAAEQLRPESRTWDTV